MTQRLRVGLYVPCFVDRFAPGVGVAAWHLLLHHGCSVVVPDRAPACCGQPFASAGQPDHARHLPGQLARAFADVDAIVLPSGSCTAFVRHHHATITSPIDRGSVARRPPTHELFAFLWHVLGVRQLSGALPTTLGIHPGCHARRHLGQGRPSESQASPRVDPVVALLGTLEQVRIVEASREDECCGFGGVFSVTEPHVSARAGRDRLDDHRHATVLTSADPSCLMHLQSLASPTRRVEHAAVVAARAAGLPHAVPT